MRHTLHILDTLFMSDAPLTKAHLLPLQGTEGAGQEVTLSPDGPHHPVAGSLLSAFYAIRLACVYYFYNGSISSRVGFPRLLHFVKSGALF